MTFSSFDQTCEYKSQQKKLKKDYLTYLFPRHPYFPPENIRKPLGFLMFSGGRERLYWEQNFNFKILTFLRIASRFHF